MNKRKLLSARVALLSVLLLSGHTAALARKPVSKLPLADVYLGMGKESAILIPPAASKAASPALPSLSVPGVAIRMAPPIISKTDVSVNVGGGGVGGSVTVPPVGGLTPPLDANVNVNTGGSGPLVSVGVDISGSGGTPGTPPPQDVYVPGLVIAQGGGQVAERSLEQVPTCR